MTVDEAKQLFAYASWANALMLEAAEALPSGEFSASVSSSFPSASTMSSLIEILPSRRWVAQDKQGS